MWKSQPMPHHPQFEQWSAPPLFPQPRKSAAPHARSLRHLAVRCGVRFGVFGEIANRVFIAAQTRKTFAHRRQVVPRLLRKAALNYRKWLASQAFAVATTPISPESGAKESIFLPEPQTAAFDTIVVGSVESPSLLFFVAQSQTRNQVCRRSLSDRWRPALIPIPFFPEHLQGT